MTAHRIAGYRLPSPMDTLEDSERFGCHDVGWLADHELAEEAWRVHAALAQGDDRRLNAILWTAGLLMPVTCRDWLRSRLIVVNGEQQARGKQARCA